MESDITTAYSDSRSETDGKSNSRTTGFVMGTHGRSSAPDLIYPVQFGGEVKVIRENGRDLFKWIGSEQINGMAYDMPIIGYGGNTVNTLRLWSARLRKNSTSRSSTKATIPRRCARRCRPRTSAKYFIPTTRCTWARNYA